MSAITPDFLQRVMHTGKLAEALGRVLKGTAHPKNKLCGSKFSSWRLICEEVLDTEYDADWYDDVIAELTRRGFNHDQIDRMRRFAWQTAGWLNYDKMLWDWCALDERDIRIALDLQLEEGLITAAQHAEQLAYIDNPLCIPSLP